MSDLEEKRVSGEEIYKGRIITLYNDKITLPDGNSAEREYVRHPGGVCILPIDSRGNVYLVRQWRYPYGKALLEVPAGKLEKGEEKLAAAARELREETGFAADSIRFISEFYPTPGYTDEVDHLYIATGLHAVGQDTDDDEFIDVVKMPYGEAYGMVMSGGIPDGKTALLILRAKEIMGVAGWHSEE